MDDASRKPRLGRKNEIKARTLQVENRITANRHKIELGRALIELKQTASRLQFEREAYRLFKIIDNGERAELMRVAALHGERPDIWQRASWTALVLLAMPSTTADLRQEFERRIETGERVTARMLSQHRAGKPPR
jgi:hypothetical protein